MFVHGESGTAEIPQSGAVETSQSDTDSVVQTAKSKSVVCLVQ